MGSVDRDLGYLEQDSCVKQDFCDSSIVGEVRHCKGSYRWVTSFMQRSQENGINPCHYPHIFYNSV